MNTDYLTTYISNRLHTIVRTYTKDKQLQNRCSKPSDFKDLLLDYPEIERFLLDIPVNGYPLLSSINQNLVYAAVTAPDCLFLIGPVRLHIQLPIKHDLTKALPEQLLLRDIYTCEFYEYMNDILLIHNLFYQEAIKEHELLSFNCISNSEQEVLTYYSNLLFQNREQENRHNPYDQELRMLSSIEQGNLQLLEKCRSEEFTGNYGTLSKNPDRNYRNISISAITLISRAAIKGGLHPEIAFSMCDSYIMKIEELKTLTELKPLVEGAKTKFAVMVQELKKHQQADSSNEYRHPLVEKCKDFIYSHLHAKITLKEIAEELQVNPNYLSELFKKYEGIPFTDFIVREKIDLTKNLLIYSPYSYIEIAAYLGFSSQSHLGKQFKSITGMTLMQFRNRFGVTEF